MIIGIADKANSPRISSITYVEAMQSGRHIFDGDGAATTLVGGHFEYQSQPVHPFIRDLPQMIHIRDLKSQERSWLTQTANLLYEEISNESPGNAIMVDRLSEIFFIHTIRAYLQQSTQVTGFLSALKDQRISTALKAIHDHPEQRWTLPALSARVGMSRTLFFNTFKALVGETPQSYLTNWRMIKAREILSTSKDNISEVALKVGYQSEAAFNRVFKMKVSQTPALYRRQLK